MEFSVCCHSNVMDLEQVSEKSHIFGHAQTLLAQ